MALKRMTVEEMIQLSTPWVTAGNVARAAIEKVPLLAALLPQLQTAHSAIFAVRAQAEDPKVQRLSQQEAEVDAKHDALVRGIYGSLSMLAQVSANADELLRLRDLLFPEGAAHTQKTYRGEAGHAALVASRLDASVQARLKAVSLQEKNLLDLVNEWLGVAKQLGDLEEERARLSPPSSSTAAEINNARLGWVRVDARSLASRRSCLSPPVQQDGLAIRVVVENPFIDQRLVELLEVLSPDDRDFFSLP